MAGHLKLEGKIAVTALKMVEAVCKIFDEQKIMYILEGGTLLGIIRENRLLPWDNDLDLTTTSPNIPALLKARFAIWKAGYRTRVRYYKEDIGPFKKGEVRMMKIQTRKYFIFKGVTLLDIFIKREVEGSYFWTVGAKNAVLKSVPVTYYDNLDRVMFNKYSYSIPQDVHGYLTCRYGDWKTPVKEWDFKKDDKAIVNKEGK
ncbi:MAG: hypothetical protein B6226_03135 [Candidatus Cloacimonetes bacterium 4572_65]|nr:MAG: hypothetical protein B6226_03135 [Candidatus Cloacimonetes bacterium 4572_65]